MNRKDFEDVCRSRVWCSPRSFLVPVALLVVLALAEPASGQDAIVHRRLILRTQPTTTSASLGALAAGVAVTLLGPQPKKGFYHVRTMDGTEGWALAKSLDVEESDAPAPAPAPPAAIATNFSSTWEKPPAKGVPFTGQEGTCPAAGDPHGDTATNARKNRSDVPPSYHDVTWKTLAELPYPVAGKTRDTWTAPQLAEIATNEGVGVTVVGYLVAIKNQTSATGESTNCHFHQSPDVDWHMALVEAPGEGEKTSVVVETTPRLLKVHPKWTIPTLTPWLNTDKPVRISGWTLLDPEHRNHLNRFRSTLWEVHPITKIEVWDGSKWIDVDAMP